MVIEKTMNIHAKNKIVMLCACGLIILLSMSCCQPKTPNDDLPPTLRSALMELGSIQSQARQPLSLEQKQRLSRLEAIIESEVVKHEESIYEHQVQVLKMAMKGECTYKYNSITNLIFKSEVNRNFFGEIRGAFTLYNKMPLVLTPYLTSYISEGVRRTIGAEKGQIIILSITNDSCQTGVVFTNYLLRVRFTRENYHWLPVEVSLYGKTGVRAGAE